ncbi:MAG: flagellar hook-associated protein FlgK [Steroidobacter sp.]
MSDMLSTGVSGLLAFQTSLDTTSHNISNASTTGYSRQTTLMTENTPQFQGGGWVGSGVNVSSIQRAYDDIVASQVRIASGAKNQWDTFVSYANQVNNLFSNSSTGITSALQDLSNAFQTVSNSPSSSAERQVVLSKAQSLVDTLQNYGSRLDQLTSQVNSQLDSEATTISGLAKSIANLNAQIVAASGQGSSAPNDLLDQRDTLIDQLSQHINVSTVKQGDGEVNVFIGTGQALVLSTTAGTITTQADPYDISRRILSLKNDTGQVDITSSLTGGTIGGLLNFRSTMLDPAKNTLGQIAVAVTTTVNQQQNAGMDLNGNLGSNLFSIGGVGVLDNANNMGAGTVSVTRSNAQQITNADYLLTYTGSGWTLNRTDTGQSITMTGAGTAGSPFVADGLSIVVGGAPVAGDRYVIQPTSNAVSGLKVNLTDPNAIAAAAPIIAAANAANTGKATITQGTVSNAANANLLNPVTIQFLSANTYTTDGGVTTNAYTSGQPINLNGWQVVISGVPAAGDTFNVQANTNGKGDNRNALLLSGVMDNGYLNGGTTSINSTVGSWIADIGVKSNQAQANQSTQTSVYNDLYATQQNQSGVNLDEEAANMIRYQQAYAAAAKIISTSNTLFQSLLQAIG